MTDGSQPMFPLPSNSPDGGNPSSYPRIGQAGPAPRPPATPPTGRGPGGMNPKVLAGIVGTVVAVMVLALVVALVDGGGGDETSADRTAGSTDRANRNPVAVSEVEPCSSPPTLAAESADLQPDGLVIMATVSPTCSGGDLLANTAFRVTAVDQAGRDVAAGVFDLSTTPIAVGDDGALVTFSFPPNSYWRIPEIVSGGLRLTAYRQGSDRSVSDNSLTPSTVRAFALGTPESGNLEAAAHSALVDIAAADRGYIDTHLLNAWQPQLSSKYPGLFADGVNWTYPDIVREHLELRQRFPGARLVWSPDWPVYNPHPHWWITLSGVPFSNGHDANNWCAAEGYDADHCYAKKLSHTLGTSETSMYR
ncbi:hypothetical protein L2K20_20470 [Mycobacterium sp. MBM]|nr:hypothetical protein [Mycobacterium sp. MBM]